MNPTFKHLLINMAKNAVNAALVTLIPIFHDPTSYNLHSGAGIKHVAVMMFGAIGAREAMVYGPKLLAWSSSTNGNGDSSTPSQPAVKDQKFSV